MLAGAAAGRPRPSPARRERDAARLAALVAWAAAGAGAVIAVAAAAGFWWLDGLAATGAAYWAGIGGRRPGRLPHAGRQPRGAGARHRAGGGGGPGRHAVPRRAPPAPGAAPRAAALAAVLVADLSQMSRGEVERIWLPFVPWLALAGARRPPRLAGGPGGRRPRPADRPRLALVGAAMADAHPRHRRRRLRRLARRRPAGRRRATRSWCSTRSSRHGERPPPWLPADAELVRGDVRDPGAWRRRAGGVDAVCHQAARVGLGVDFGDVGATWTTTTPARPRGCGRCTSCGSGADRAGVEHGRLRRGALPVPAPRRRPPGRRATRGRPRRRPVRPAVPRAAGRRCAWAPVDEDAPLDPRNVYAATKLHQEHLCAAFGREHGGAGDRPALPQRLRAADAPRHAVRRRGAIFRSAVERGRAAAGVRGRRPDPRLRARRRRRPGQRAALTGAEPVDRAPQRRVGPPRTVLDMARAVCDGTGPRRPRSWAAAGWATSATSSPARSGPPTALGFRAIEAFTRRSPLRGPLRPGAGEP